MNTSRREFRVTQAEYIPWNASAEIEAIEEPKDLARPAGVGRGSATVYRVRIVGRTEELDAIRRLKLA